MQQTVFSFSHFALLQAQDECARNKRIEKWLVNEFSIQRKEAALTRTDKKLKELYLSYLKDSFCNLFALIVVLSVKNFDN